LFISSKIDPRTQVTMAHYEIFEGTTTNAGANWTWAPITFNSTVDNLRPIVPKWNADQTALLWMRGTYSSFTSYDLDIVALTDITSLVQYPLGDLDRDQDIDADDFALYLSGLHADLSGLTPEQAYMEGDLNGDLVNDFRDFVLFRGAYDMAHGAGSLAALAVALPEPAGLGLLALGGIGGALARRAAASHRRFAKKEWGGG
jgi:hypothetical protein